MIIYLKSHSQLLMCVVVYSANILGKCMFKEKGNSRSLDLLLVSPEPVILGDFYQVNTYSHDLMRHG